VNWPRSRKEEHPRGSHPWGKVKGTTLICYYQKGDATRKKKEILGSQRPRSVGQNDQRWTHTLLGGERPDQGGRKFVGKAPSCL